jgi:osmotically-inducible protein OsmY
MNSSFNHRAWCSCALLGALVYGGAAVASAQSFTSAANAASAADEQLQERVAAALHADRFFFDRHIVVSVQDGVVVLRGLVFSDWDLRDALRIARKAAGENLVVNSLTLIQGGRR